MKICPDCGGAQVQDLVTIWVDANTDERINDGEMHLAEMYQDIHWCDTCQDHKSYWIETECLSKDAIRKLLKEPLN
jgi:hypothetical protein